MVLMNLPISVKKDLMLNALHKKLINGMEIVRNNIKMNKNFFLPSQVLMDLKSQQLPMLMDQQKLKVEMKRSLGPMMHLIIFQAMGLMMHQIMLQAPFH